MDRIEKILRNIGEFSDGYHTFNELYDYRKAYNAAFFNELSKQGLYDVHKSRFHSDGEIPFGDDNWFIVRRTVVDNDFEKGNPHCIITIKNL